MKVELNLMGDTIQISLDAMTSENLYSFLEYFTRERLDSDIVTEEEYMVAETLANDMRMYIRD